MLIPKEFFSSEFVSFIYFLLRLYGYLTEQKMCREFFEPGLIAAIKHPLRRTLVLTDQYSAHPGHAY